MATRLEGIMGMRNLLDFPYPNKPSFTNLLKQQISEETDIANELNNTGRPWSTQTITLNYPANGLNTLTINAANFGKVLFVVRLLPNNPFISALPVPFADIGELQYGTILAPYYSIYANWITVPANTVEKMAFYREDVINPQFKVKIEPLPQESCQYEVTYLVGAIGNNDPLSSSIALPEHASLAQLRGAMAQLPYAQWSEDAVADTVKKKELAAAFMYQLSRKEPIFKEYKKSLVHPRQVEIDWTGSY